MRWIWIDRFVTFESGKFARAIKNLALAEEVFGEHFPGFPVMPAALMLEGMAQTGGLLVGEANQFKEKVILAKIPRASFIREAYAGETLTYEATITSMREEGASIEGQILIGEEKIAEIEIFFAHLDQARSGAIFGDKNFVFDGELQALWGLNQAVVKRSE
jgi:3-hydroxyacyl-[acyl-carrier-protein] dehydratase